MGKEWRDLFVLICYEWEVEVVLDYFGVCDTDRFCIEAECSVRDLAYFYGVAVVPLAGVGVCVFVVDDDGVESFLVYLFYYYFDRGCLGPVCGEDFGCGSARPD